MSLLFNNNMNFLQVYNKYKNQYRLITEGNVKTLYPSIQRMVLKGQFNGLSYQELTNEQKEEFQKRFDTLVKMYSGGYVDMVTPNKQYRSWLYDMWAKSFDLFDKDDEQQNQFETGGLENLSKMLKQYEVICRSPKVDQQHKNIFNFKTFKELYDFIEDFRANNTKILQSKFKKVCDNDSYDVYAIYLKDKDQFQQIYGEAGYNVGWCVVNLEKNMFESYLEQSLTPNDCYYLWTYKGTNKPFALLHFDSGQFKDIHNDCMLEYEDEIYQCLLKLMKIHNITWSDCSGDLTSYRYIYYYKNKQLGQLIVTDDELAIYLADEHLDLPADCYVLTNGNENVVGYFSIDNYNYAGGLGQSKQPTILFLIYKLRPGIFIKLCKLVGQPFDNQLFINDMKNNNCFDFVNLITHASNVQVKWTEHDYQILLASGYYILYNKKENRYLAYGELVNKRFHIGNPMNINKPQNIDKNIADIFIKGMKQINNNIIID